MGMFTLLGKWFQMLIIAHHSNTLLNFGTCYWTTILKFSFQQIKYFKRSNRFLHKYIYIYIFENFSISENKINNVKIISKGIKNYIPTKQNELIMVKKQGQTSSIWQILWSVWMEVTQLGQEKTSWNLRITNHLCMCDIV